MALNYLVRLDYTTVNATLSQENYIIKKTYNIPNNNQCLENVFAIFWFVFLSFKWFKYEIKFVSSNKLSNSSQFECVKVQAFLKVGCTHSYRVTSGSKF